jgi:hypothetical protein
LFTFPYEVQNGGARSNYGQIRVFLSFPSTSLKKKRSIEYFNAIIISVNHLFLKQFCMGNTTSEVASGVKAQIDSGGQRPELYRFVDMTVIISFRFLFFSITNI